MEQIMSPMKAALQYGELFEQFFKIICTVNGLVEGQDFYKAKPPLPDFYFPKTRTYVEIKSRSASTVVYSELQKETIKKLIDEGYKVKTLMFTINISDAMIEDGSLQKLIYELTGASYDIMPFDTSRLFEIWEKENQEAKKQQTLDKHMKLPKKK